MLERITRSYQVVQDNVTEEDASLANCNVTITCVESMQKEVENSIGKGSPDYYDICFSQEKSRHLLYPIAWTLLLVQFG